MKKEKKEKDVMVRMSANARNRFKARAAEKGMSLKEFFDNLYV